MTAPAIPAFSADRLWMAEDLANLRSIRNSLRVLADDYNSDAELALHLADATGEVEESISRLEFLLK